MELPVGAPEVAVRLQPPVHPPAAGEGAVGVLQQKPPTHIIRNSAPAPAAAARAAGRANAVTLPGAPRAEAPGGAAESLGGLAAQVAGPG